MNSPETHSLDLWNSDLSLIDLARKERTLKMQIKGINYAVKNRDLLKLRNIPKGMLRKKQIELIGVQEKLTIVYN